MMILMSSQNNWLKTLLRPKLVGGCSADGRKEHLEEVKSTNLILTLQNRVRESCELLQRGFV